METKPRTTAETDNACLEFVYKLVLNSQNGVFSEGFAQELHELHLAGRIELRSFRYNRRWLFHAVVKPPKVSLAHVFRNVRVSRELTETSPADLMSVVKRGPIMLMSEQELEEQPTL